MDTNPQSHGARVPLILLKRKSKSKVNGGEVSAIQHILEVSMYTCTIVVSHLKGTAIVYKPHVLRRCLSSQGTSMYPRVHEGCWATVASSQNCETISGHYKSYYGTSHLYHGFLRCMGFVPSCSCMSSLGLRPREDIQLPSGTNPIHLETHGTNITCMLVLTYS